MLYYVICLNWGIYLITIILTMLGNNFNISIMNNDLSFIIMIGTHIVSILELLISLPNYFLKMISGNTEIKNYYRKNTILSFIHCVCFFVTMFIVVVPKQI